MAGGFIKLAVVISAHQRGFRIFDKAQNKLKGLGKAALAVAPEFALLGAMIAEEFATKAITAFAQFEHGMAKIQAITKATGEQFDSLRNKALEMARSTIFTAQEVTDAMFYMSQAGLTVDEVMGSVKSTLDLALVGFMDLGKASDIVTDIMRALNLETSELAGVTDILVETYSSYNTSVEQLGTAFSYVAPIARTLGVDINVLSASIGILSSAGIKGERAGTAMRNVLVKLINPSIDAQRTLDELGVTVFDSTGKFVGLVELLQQFKNSGASATQIMKVFQMRAGPAFIALMESIQGSDRSLIEFSEHLASAETSGAASRAAGVIEESPEAKMLKFKAKIHEVFINIGAELFPLVDELMNALFPPDGGESAFFEAFKDLVKNIIVLLNTMLPTIKMIMKALAWVMQFTADNWYGILAAILFVVIGIGIAFAPLIVNAIVLAGALKIVLITLGAIVGILAGVPALGWIFQELGENVFQRRQRGGEIRRTGLYYLHAPEKVVNPLAGQDSPQNLSGTSDTSSRRSMSVSNNYNFYGATSASASRQERENRKYLRRLAYR